MSCRIDVGFCAFLKSESTFFEGMDDLIARLGRNKDVVGEVRRYEEDGAVGQKVSRISLPQEVNGEYRHFCHRQRSCQLEDTLACFQTFTINLDDYKVLRGDTSTAPWGSAVAVHTRNDRGKKLLGQSFGADHSAFDRIDGDVQKGMLVRPRRLWRLLVVSRMTVHAVGLFPFSRSFRGRE